MTLDPASDTILGTVWHLLAKWCLIMNCASGDEGTGLALRIVACRGKMSRRIAWFCVDFDSLFPSVDYLTEWFHHCGEPIKEHSEVNS